MMGQGDNQYFYLGVPIHLAITISTKFPCLDVMKMLAILGESWVNIMMMTIMKKMLSIPGERWWWLWWICGHPRGEVGQGSSQGCHILRYNYLPYLGRFPCLDVTTRMWWRCWLSQGEDGSREWPRLLLVPPWLPVDASDPAHCIMQHEKICYRKIKHDNNTIRWWYMNTPPTQLTV